MYVFYYTIIVYDFDVPIQIITLDTFNNRKNDT